MADSSEYQEQLARWIHRACLLECAAAKPGNVHPDASFDDLCYDDFVRSADAVAPILAKTRELGVGRAIRDAVCETQSAVGKNTNLGIVLLLAPLAAVNPETPLSLGLGKVLAELTQDDAEFVYEAIRLAQPSGMGKVEEGDVTAGPTGTLLEMMQLAADRDAIAAQYSNGFDLVFNTGLPFLANVPPEHAVVALHLHLMAVQPDTLIARKCGLEIANESAKRAKAVLLAGWPESEQSRALFQELDKWLRADGHRRNPGTTADLVTAVLFTGMRDGVVSL